MVELKYVKRRRRRKIAAFVAMVSVTGMVALGIVAFLGRNVGTYTVSLDSKQVELSLSRKHPSDERTSFLYIDSVPTFGQFTYSNFESLGEDIIDNQEYDWNMDDAVNYSVVDDRILSLNYFKYTFFVKNVGDKYAGYTMKFNLFDDHVSTDGTNRYISDTLRVMIYDNEALSDQHNKVIYAKAPDVPREDENGNLVGQEYVSTSPSRDSFYGFATNFESYDKSRGRGVITTLENTFIAPGEARRYTFVAWMEGEDMSDRSSHSPEGASIKLGVTINGYETQQE